MPYYVTVTLKVLWIFGPNHSKTIAAKLSPRVVCTQGFFCHPQGGAPIFVSCFKTHPTRLIITAILNKIVTQLPLIEVRLIITR